MRENPTLISSTPRPFGGRGIPRTAFLPAALATALFLAWQLGHAANPQLKACDLLTKAEVAEIIGKAIAKAEAVRDRERIQGASQCHFFTSSGEYALSVDYDRSGSARGQWNIFFKPQPGRVAGIGDDARWSPPYLRILVGEAILEIFLPGPRSWGRSEEEVKAMALRLAKKALSRVR